MAVVTAVLEGVIKSILIYHVYINSCYNWYRNIISLFDCFDHADNPSNTRTIYNVYYYVFSSSCSSVSPNLFDLWKWRRGKYLLLSYMLWFEVEERRRFT
jgi:hypothetical protein